MLKVMLKVMLKRLFSFNTPGHRALTWGLVLMALALAAAPWLFPGSKALGVAAKALIFILLVASYDLLLGYTGIVSFAHTMFFGIGAYGVAVSSAHWGASWGSLVAGVTLALLLSLVLSLAIGLFSLRVKAIFYAMITLAVATAFMTLASQLSDITGGEDGPAVGSLDIYYCFSPTPIVTCDSASGTSWPPVSVATLPTVAVRLLISLDTSLPTGSAPVVSRRVFKSKA